MKNLKAFQRNELILEYGLLMAPLAELARMDQTPPVYHYRIAVAKVQAGDSEWRRKVKKFTTFANDIFLNDEYQEISHIPERCLRDMKALISDPNLSQELVQQNVANYHRMFLEYVDYVPVDWEPIIFEANTPFTSYLRIKEAIVTVKQRFHYFDRYLKPDFFELFLASVDKNISIRLVTTSGNNQYGVAGISALSTLARQQFNDFQLIEVSPSDLHDRNLRIDDRIFTLGPGVDRAGIALTNFGPSDNSQNAQIEFDRIIAGGRVVS